MRRPDNNDNNAYRHAILYPELGMAPRMSAAWAALLALLSDGAEHTSDECTAVLLSHDLAPRTARNLLTTARGLGRIRARRGKAVRPYQDGDGLKVVSAYIAYSIAIEVSEP